jgi:hypothetical protein
MAHAGAEAGVQALVQELQGLAGGGLDLGAHGQQGGQRGRQGVARADEAGVEELELLAGQGPWAEASTLSMNCPALAGSITPVTST